MLIKTTYHRTFIACVVLLLFVVVTIQNRQNIEFSWDRNGFEPSSPIDATSGTSDADNHPAEPQSAPPVPSSQKDATPGKDDVDNRPAEPLSALPVPPEYMNETEAPPSCADRFGLKYLENLRDYRTEYCPNDSPSTMSCFHSQTANDGRVDSFCLGRAADFNPEEKKFSLACDVIDSPPQKDARRVPQISKMSAYWYETGPRVILQDFVSFGTSKSVKHQQQPSGTYSILIKREIEKNLWHTLMEIIHLTLSLDVLRMTRDPGNNSPLFTASDVENTQVVVLDNKEEGLFWDLWRLMARKPMVRLKDIQEGGGSVGNIIIPLAGGGNPFWQADWEVLTCDSSPLLRTFVGRVLGFYDIKTSEPSAEVVNAVYISRGKHRELQDEDALLEAARKQIPHLNITKVDFASMGLKEQIQVARDADVLVGVHGAGLTHGLWLHPHSALVEILPKDLKHKGFRNLAAMLGHRYFSAYALESKRRKREWQPEDGQATEMRQQRKNEQRSVESLGDEKLDGRQGRRRMKRDWHFDNVSIEEKRFVALVQAAVDSVYNQGSRNFDII